VVLTWLLVIPIIGGLLAWLLGRDAPARARAVALSACIVDFVLAAMLWWQSNLTGFMTQVVVEQYLQWIPRFGIRYHLIMDGTSLLLVMLTGFLGIIAVAASWREIKDGSGAFYLALLSVLTGVTGVFLARDLLLFYFFWELMLVPMYFLIALWGHENRHYAAIKFFLFTFISSVFMLAAILVLVVIHAETTGTLTFDAQALAGTPLSSTVGLLLMLGFFIAFITKLPAVPVHTWLADAHTEAPTGGSIILAGLMLKTGAYGLIRFAVPLFPEAAATFAPYAQIIGVIGILYGAMMAFAQNDLKRVIAYSSISHMGFVLLGIYAGNDIALQGAVIQIIAHGLSTPALFFLAGSVQERCNTRDVEELGGLWQVAPKLGGFMLFFSLASLALPGTINFNGEFLVLLGVFQVWPLMGIIASGGFILSVVYSLRLVQEVIHGPNSHSWLIPDLAKREIVALGLLAALILAGGFLPRLIVRTTQPSLPAIAHVLSRPASIGAIVTPWHESTPYTYVDGERVR
jgi:NADH-quinone oxidoreductase subunit M